MSPSVTLSIADNLLLFLRQNQHCKISRLMTNPNTPTEILCELIAIPSVNPMGHSGVDDIYFESRVADWVETFFSSIGAPCQRMAIAPRRDNLVAFYRNPTSNDTIWLDAHLDTVPTEGMTIQPFVPEISDGRITGRGSTDVKGGLAAMLHAFQRLHRESPEGAANVVLSCTVDEEHTATGVQSLVREWTEDRYWQTLEMPRPSVAIVAEPTLLNVVVAHRGVLRFEIHTAGRACHSSDPSQGENAIYKMAHVVSLLEEYAHALSKSVPAHALCGHPTLSIGTIEGGSSVNIVPHECKIQVDRRIIPGEDPQAIYDELCTTINERLEFDVDFQTPWLACPPLEDDTNQELAGTLLDSINRFEADRKSIGVPYGTNGSFTGTYVPSVVFGPGSIDQAHTSDEYIEIAQLNKAADIYFDFCASYQRPSS